MFSVFVFDFKEQGCQRKLLTVKEGLLQCTAIEHMKSQLKLQAYVQNLILTSKDVSLYSQDAIRMIFSMPQCLRVHIENPLRCSNANFLNINLDVLIWGLDLLINESSMRCDM